MPRIAGVPTRDAGPLGRLAYRIARYRYRYRYRAVPEPATVLLHHRRAFWAYALWELGNEKAMRRLPASLREVAVYRWPPSGEPPGPVQPCPGYHRPGIHLRAGMPCATSFVNARATSAPKSTPMVAHITS